MTIESKRLNAEKQPYAEWVVIYMPHQNLVSSQCYSPKNLHPQVAIKVCTSVTHNSG